MQQSSMQPSTMQKSTMQQNTMQPGTNGKHWPRALRDGALRGLVPAVASTAVLALCSRRRGQSAYAPTNAVSHWLWGDRAFRQDAPSLRYTLVGYAVHHASASFWAIVQERLFGRKVDRLRPGQLLALSMATSAFACFADYKLTPPRLRPGYEQRLTRTDLFAVYALFGVGLAAGAWLMRNSDERNDHGKH
jgi:hypothetical protein